MKIRWFSEELPTIADDWRLPKIPEKTRRCFEHISYISHSPESRVQSPESRVQSPESSPVQSPVQVLDYAVKHWAGAQNVEESQKGKMGHLYGIFTKYSNLQIRRTFFMSSKAASVQGVEETAM